MSIQSTPHPLSNKVSNKSSIKKTHMYHSEFLNQLNPKMYAITPNNNSELLDVNIEDRKLCSVQTDKFGEISGCSLQHKKMYDTKTPDFIKKLSSDSFTSQIFDHNFELGSKKVDPRNNKKQFTSLPGFELTKGLQLNRIDGLPDNLDDTDLYGSYCQKKYQQEFPLKK
tara:strand:- start:50 stop:556 length:507 start_codon:yes stop_codon:yes gene_type:complete